MDIYTFWFEPEIPLIRHWIPIDDKAKLLFISKLEPYLDTIFRIYHSSLQLSYSKKTIENLQIISLKQRIEAILSLDQFSRNLSYKYPNIKAFIPHLTRKAILYSFSILDNSEYLQLQSNELIFVLMPFKHLHIEALPFIYNIVHSYLKYHQTTFENHSQLQSFFLDYVEKYYMKYTNPYIYIDISQDVSILSSICEYLPSEWKQLRYVFNNENTEMETSILKSLNQYNIKGKICVSLSGGVDSMVLLYILKHLSRQYPIEPIAFHLYYGNREVALTERLLVSEYCQKLDVPLWTYDIDYIKRGEIQRDGYEKITRNIRFECYRQMNCPIGLGHIWDDQIENIFTNVVTNKHMFHLSKFESICIQEDVLLYRPLLDIHKSDIYTYAEKHCIPHLLNTTPEWSNRGKFRNHFLPSYMTQYGKESLDNVHQFAFQLHQYGNILHKCLIQPKIEALTSGGKIEFTFEELENQHYIREVFTGYCHNKGIHMPSERTVHDFIQRYKRQLQDPQNHILKFPIRHNVIIKIKDKSIYI